MRYLLHESQVNELVSRKIYLYDVFHIFFLPGHPEGRYIPLSPIGVKGPSILFITGHTNYVQEYLDSNIAEIPEKTIVITSCFGVSFKKYASKKTIFVPDGAGSLCLLRDGTPFGFNFDISDSELNLYNAPGEIMNRIKSAYKAL